MLILGAFLGVLRNLFRSSTYAPLLLIESDPMSNNLNDMQHHQQRLEATWWLASLMCLLHAATCAASFLNVLSHAAVALGALNDTYVLSILVGVGFDVLTRILQLVWWVCITICMSKNHKPSTAKVLLKQDDTPPETADDTAIDSSTPLLLLFLLFFYVYHMIFHVQAMRMNHSLSRLQAVLNSALNNLRGIPGEGYLDHLFAYTDLGTHLFACCVSALLLRKEGALWLAVGLLGILIGISYGILSRVPFSEIVSSSNAGLASMVEVQGTTITCSCRACTARKKERVIGDHHPAVSFTVSPRDGICQLLLCSFEQLSGILSSIAKP